MELVTIRRRGRLSNKQYFPSRAHAAGPHTGRRSPNGIASRKAATPIINLAFSGLIVVPREAMLT